MIRVGNRRRPRLMAVVGPAVVAVAITALAAAGLGAGAFSSFRRQATDALFPSSALNPDIVVVGIDSKALANVGKPWPWPRDLHASIVEQLGRAGARLVVYDALFAPATDADDDLATALKTTPVVLAAVGTDPSQSSSGPFRFGTLTQPVPALAAAATAVAHANVTADPVDGVVRSVPLVVEDPQQRFVPSLALQAFRIIERQPNQIVVRPNGVQVGSRFIPTDRHAGLRVNYPAGLGLVGPNYISALDVMRGDFAEGRVKGKTVLVGAADVGLGDHRLVPVNKGEGVPGVFIHASALQTMANRAYLKEAPLAVTLLWILLLAYVVALLSQSARLWIATPASIAVAAAWLQFVFTRFDNGRIFDLVYPGLTIALAFLAGVVLRYMTEGRRRRRVTSIFSQYVPGAVADQLCNDDRLDEAIAGQRVEATILFCDLRGFTAMSENLAATDVRAVCDVYYEQLTEIVYRHGGTLMSYLGDAVFAVFGAPLPQDDHAAAALRAALDMLAGAPGMTAELEAQGLPWLPYGIGLNTGEVVAACVGGTHRRQYTVLGDAVNISSRLCSLAGGSEIILSDAVRQQIPQEAMPPLESVGPVALKNVTRDLVLWRVAGGPALPADMADIGRSMV